MDHLDEIARHDGIIGAVNTVRREGDGVIGEHRRLGLVSNCIRQTAGSDPNGNLLLGAGGATFWSNEAVIALEMWTGQKAPQAVMKAAVPHGVENEVTEIARHLHNLRRRGNFRILIRHLSR